MLGGYERYSLRRKSRAKPVLKVLGVVALALVLHALITGLALFSLRVDSVSMEPRLSPGDRLLATPLVFGIPVSFLPPGVRSYGSPHRGDLVVFELPGTPASSWLKGMGEGLVRFVTLNRRGLDPGPYGRPLARLSVKRVVGLPGDTIRMRSLQAFIRPSGHSGFQPEGELVPDSGVDTRQAAQSGPGIPFSGDLEDIVLGSDEFFVLGDNRARSSDSRSWGVVPLSSLRGRPLFRYWPVTRVGSL